MSNIKLKRIAFAAFLILLASLSRLLPHEANFTPIFGLFLLGAAYLGNKKLVYILPLLAILISDLFLGLYSSILYTYAAYIMIIFVASILFKKLSASKVAFASIIAPAIFFVVSNLGVWAGTGLYTHNLSGLMLCYESAIPFFRSTLLSSVVSTGALFAIYNVAIKYIPQLSEQTQSEQI